VKPDHEGIEGLGRFGEPSLYILMSLGDGAKHGYAIMQDIEAISGQPLGPGTLYGSLARLEQRGLIEPLEPEDRRRPYRLTDLGAAALRAQLAQIRTFVALGERRLRKAEK
jgi:DNA-binding PadR family transcriptional regulator